MHGGRAVERAADWPLCIVTETVRRRRCGAGGIGVGGATNLYKLARPQHACLAYQKQPHFKLLQDLSLRPGYSASMTEEQPLASPEMSISGNSSDSDSDIGFDYPHGNVGPRSLVNDLRAIHSYH